MASDDDQKSGKPEPRVGSYRLIEQLGSGGMSSVYRAVHAETEHEVAVKILPRVLAKNPTLLQRFLREAKSAEALEHPNIVSIFDRGVDQGRHYLVLEYVAGGDLHDRVKGQGPLSIADAVHVIRTVAEGLRYASSQGLIHRDIKPANLLLSPSGQVKIIDLGLALQAESEDERVTRDGTTVGTVDYMSPEQARDSRGTSERSDIYSLGCTFYYLLTGSPPFPGGDLADKLGRHCTKPAPDPRKLRPEIPEALAAVLKRMMAKRPENRYENYDKLIMALDAAPLKHEPKAAEPLDALIDDDEEDAPPAPLVALIADDSDPALPVSSGKPPSRPAPVALEALIADDSDDQIPVPPSNRATGKKSSAASHFDALPLAELAALEDDAPRSRQFPVPRAQPAKAPQPDPAQTSLIDEESEGALPGFHGSAPRRSSDASTETWVKRCVVIGLALVLLVIGVDQLIRASRGTSEDGTETTTASDPEPGPAERAPIAAGTQPDRPTIIRKPVAGPKPEAAPVSAAWVEPADVAPESVAEPGLGPLEAKFVPAWATLPVPERLGGPVTSVRRIADPAAGFEKTTIRQALDVIGGATIELGDNGPLFEDDLHIAGDSRLIRARAGFRPIICIEASKLPIVREQPAIVVLEGKDSPKQLVLDGLDIVVDVDELPREQSALFLCRGAHLTLKNCSITVVNPRNLPFAVVRTSSGAYPTRIRLEGTFVRGQSLTAFDLAGGPAEVVLSRSVLIEGPAPLVSSGGPDSAAERRINIVRSVLACRAPVLELVAPASGSRPKAVVIRALGSTFACVQGAKPSSLFAGREGAGGANEFIQWEGDQNAFAGWSAWLAIGKDHAVKVADLAGARKIWPATDPQSRESAESWPDSTSFDRSLPIHLKSLAPAARATLTRVATPSAFLHEKTVASFERGLVPELAPEAPVPIAPKVSPVAVPAPPSVVPAKPRAVAKGKVAQAVPVFVPVRPAAPPAPPKPPEGELTFDANASTWNGDLGLFLNSEAPRAGKRIRVHVWGKGEHPWTALELADGVSLEILVDAARTPRGALSWTALPSSEGEALIALRGGDLVLSGVNLARDGGTKLKSLVRVEGGHLVLNRCRLKAPGFVTAGGGGLISFSQATTRPLNGGPGPFTTVVNRPVCRLLDSVLITGGDALTVELGRGLIALSECAIAAGHCAFVLTPAKVARARLDNDLWLDHCTVAAERDFFRLNPWTGSDPGPDRPWLVSSRNSAYIANYQGGQRESVLLRSEGAALARGALFWEGYNDAYEVTNFTASGDGPPPSNPRPDVRRQWTGLWGARHFQRVTGPGTVKVGSPPSARFLERLKPGEVAPENLVLDPNVHRDRRSLTIGATPARLGLPTPPVRN